jgi:hypothetical protein
MMGGGGVHVPARKNITEKRKNKQQRQATVDQPSPTPTTHHPPPTQKILPIQRV